MNFDIGEIILFIIFILYVLLEKLLIPSKLEKIRSDLSEKLEEIKSLYSKEQFIHKLQFEKEFKIYEELWKKLVNLKEETEKLIPIIDFREPGKDDAEINKERLQNVKEAYSEVRKVINYNKPFYDKKVYENTEKILSQSFRQALSVRYPNRDESKQFVKAEERNREIFAVIYEIEVAIRNRIQIMEEAKLIG